MPLCTGLWMETFDTNVIVRLLVEDDLQQSAIALRKWSLVGRATSLCCPTLSGFWSGMIHFSQLPRHFHDRRQASRLCAFLQALVKTH